MPVRCVIPMTEIIKGAPLVNSGGGRNNSIGTQRLEVMDQQGPDTQA
jgi:hypothetical protein